MKFKSRELFVLVCTLMSILLHRTSSDAQERIKVAYSSPDATNFSWFAALDAGFYRKNEQMED